MANKITLQTCFENALNKHGIKNGMFAINQHSGNYLNLWVQASFMRLRINRSLWKAKDEANEIIEMCKANINMLYGKYGSEDSDSCFNHIKPYLNMVKVSNS